MTRAALSALLALALAQAAHAAGRAGKIEGRVHGPDNKPLAGATVDCTKGVGGGDDSSACGAVQTGADGAFALNSPAGVVTVWARAPGCAEGRAALVVPAGGTVRTQVTLPPGSQVAGQAKGEDGKPVPNANVRCGALEDLGPVQQIVAGPDGSFTCKDVGSGPVEVLAWTKEARAAGMAMVEPGGKADLSLALSSRESASARTEVAGVPGFELAALPPAQNPPPGVVKGRVVDAVTKKPLASAGVKLKPGRWAVTGPDGRFSAIAGPGPTVVDLGTAPRRAGGALAVIPSEGEVDVGEVRVVVGPAAEEPFGAGVEVAEGGLVLRPRVDGPAWMAGARPGDKLLTVAGREASKMQVADAVLALGKARGKALLTVEREGKKQDLKLVVAAK